MYWKRHLALAVVIKPASAKFNMLRHQEDEDEDEFTHQGGVTLSSCFNGFSNLDTLSGDN